jgi:hypothetical protein
MRLFASDLSECVMREKNTWSEVLGVTIVCLVSQAQFNLRYDVS